MVKISTAPVCVRALATVNAFNERWPVGTAVMCQRLRSHAATTFRTFTTCPAFVAGGEAMIGVEGQNGFLPLEQCRPAGETRLE
jgi:hypothetical protein